MSLCIENLYGKTFLMFYLHDCLTSCFILPQSCEATYINIDHHDLDLFGRNSTQSDIKRRRQAVVATNAVQVVRDTYVNNVWLPEYSFACDKCLYVPKEIYVNKVYNDTIM